MLHTVNIILILYSVNIFGFCKVYVCFRHMLCLCTMIIIVLKSSYVMFMYSDNYCTKICLFDHSPTQ